jgi:uncharacterized membrane protein YdbT with pleckstrin-like domain
MVLALVAMGIVGNAEQNSPDGNGSTAWQLAGVVAILALIGGIVSLIRGILFLWSAEYAVTDRRVIGKYGVIRRHAVDVMMTQMSGVTVSQSALGRIFRYGALWVNASGTRQRLDYIANPLAFRAAVYARLDQSRLLKGMAAYTLDVRTVPGDPPAQEAAAGTRFCSRCGKAVPATSRFCDNCGAPVSQPLSP